MRLHMKKPLAYTRIERGYLRSLLVLEDSDRSSDIPDIGTARRAPF